MDNSVIRKDCLEQYENQVKWLFGAFIRAYQNCYYLKGIDERRKQYLENQSEAIFFQYSIEFFYAIIYALQKEAILLLCSIEDFNPKANSLSKLNNSLSEYAKDVKLIQDQIVKKPKKRKIQHIRDCRNQKIAHIELGKEIDGVSMAEVEERLNELRVCYNSYLFDGMIKYAINDNKLKDIEEDCCLGVNQLFSGEMDKHFMRAERG